MELFQKGVDKGSPEAHLYIGMGYLCMYNIHVIYTHIQERERERREGGRCAHSHIHVYTHSFLFKMDLVSKLIRCVESLVYRLRHLKEVWLV